MTVAASMLGQEIHEETQRMPVPPSNVQANLDAKQRQLDALDARIKALGERPGEGAILAPAFEQRALERLLEVGVRKESELAKDLDEDAWDVAAWCDQAESTKLIEQMGASPVPLRHWRITDKGRETIG